MRVGAIAALGLGCSAPAAGAHAGHNFPVVGVTAVGYSPPAVTVTSGDLVFWQWDGLGGSQTVTFTGIDCDSDPTGKPNHPDKDQFVCAFEKPGTYSYHSRTSGITGTVTVNPAPPPPAVTLALSNLRLSPSSACIAKSRSCRRPGSVLACSLSSNATVRITLTRSGVAKPARTLNRAGGAGDNLIAISLRGLRAGRYRVAVSAFDASGNTTAPQTRTLSVRR
jgi:plastocyanin